MDELTRRALARVPMTESAIRDIYGDTNGHFYTESAGEVVRALCESHERLRYELEGAEKLLREAEGGKP